MSTHFDTAIHHRDGQTDRQTLNDSICRAIMHASHRTAKPNGAKLSELDMKGMKCYKIMSGK